MRIIYLIYLFFLFPLLGFAGNLPTDSLKVGAAQHRAVEKLSGAIQFKTVSAVEEENFAYEEFLKLHRYLVQAFPLVHRYLQPEVVNGYSLLYTWRGGQPDLKPILLSAHLDVVPVEAASEGQWQEQPYAGKVLNGEIWGRGTMDDKYRVVAILEAVEQLLEQGFMPKRTIYLAFGHDEEVGGYAGAGAISALLQARQVQLEAVFDEGLAVAEDVLPGVEEPLAFVGTAAKGNLNLRLSVQGEGGHSSVPPQETPIGILSQAISRLEANPFKPRMISTTRETVDALAGHLGGKYKFAMQHYWLFKGKILKMLSEDRATDALIRTKMVPTVIQAGDKYNVLPREAYAVINIRILNGETQETVLQHVRQAINDERVQLSMHGVYTPPSPVTSTDTWVYHALMTAISETFPGIVTVPALFPGATDSKHYANLTSNIFRFAPQVVNRQNAQLIHNVNERLSVEVFEKCIVFYDSLIRNTAGARKSEYIVEKKKPGLPIGVNGE